MKKLSIALLALVMAMSMLVVPAVAVADGGGDPVLTLENKDADWQVLSDSTGGTLTYYSSGSEFLFKLEATGLEESTEYNLIYYADLPDRFVDWGGDNPGALIATISTGSGGKIPLTSWISVELNKDLPSCPDANICEHDYTLPPDNYTNAHGAKIWLVPSDCCTGPEVTTWAPSRFLFETDLITYNDTDVDTTCVCTQVEDTIISIDVTPTSLVFGSLVAGATSATQNLTIENTGTVNVHVTAETASAFYQAALQLEGSSWELVDDWFAWVNQGDSLSVGARVVVPGGWAAGTEMGTVVFWAQLP